MPSSQMKVVLQCNAYAKGSKDGGAVLPPSA